MYCTTAMNVNSRRDTSYLLVSRFVYQIIVAGTFGASRTVSSLLSTMGWWSRNLLITHWQNALKSLQLFTVLQSSRWVQYSIK